MSDDTIDIDLGIDAMSARAKLSIFGAIGETYLYFVTRILIIIRLILPLVLSIAGLFACLYFLIARGDLSRFEDPDIFLIEQNLIILALSILVFGVLMFLSALSFVVGLLRHIVLGEKPTGLFSLGAPAARYFFGSILMGLWIGFLIALVGSIIFVPLVMMGLDFDSLDSMGSIAALVIGGIFMLFFILYLAIRYALVAPAIVVENKIRFRPGIKAIKGNYWRFIFTMILFWISWMVINIVLMMVVFAGFGQEPMSVMEYLATNGELMDPYGGINVEAITAPVLIHQAISGLMQISLSMIIYGVIYKRLRVTD